jgi:deoxyribonuclease V
METRTLHDWNVTPAEAVQIQRKLASAVRQKDETGSPHYIGGADVSATRAHGAATVALVVISYPALEIVDSSVLKCETTFPYVPGLLSFREAPLLLEACKGLKTGFDLLLVDGQGIAHPRRFGLAAHLGLILNKPVLGCAKSLLIGEYEEPGQQAGCWSKLVDSGEVIGAAVRTKDGVKPIFVSVGHRVDLPAAIKWSLACCKGYRIPEPLRLAHMASKGLKL